MEALGGELENYLLESEDYKPKKNEEKKVSFVDRFKAEFLSSPNKPKASKPKKADPFKDKKSADNAAKLVSIFAHLAFKNFKKAHGMIMW